MALIKNPKYNLKLKYKRMVKLSLILSLMLVIAAFKFSPMAGEVALIEEQGQVVISVVDIPPQTNIEPPKEQPKTPKLILTDEPTDIDIEIGPTDIDLNANQDPPPLPFKDVNTDIDEPQPPYRKWAEIMPEPIGGIAEIQEKIVYPDIAVKTGIQGQVLVLAYVNENGDVDKVELLKGIFDPCDIEALNAVKNTKFSPAIQGDRPVRCEVVVPIIFKIQ